MWESSCPWFRDSAGVEFLGTLKGMGMCAVFVNVCGMELIGWLMVITIALEIFLPQ